MIVEDLNAFVADFGEDYLFTRSSVPVVTARMIRDAPPFEFSAHDRSFFDSRNYEVTGVVSEVKLLGVEAILDPIQVNDVTNFGGKDWYVITKIPDGIGMAVLGLSDIPLNPK